MQLDGSDKHTPDPGKQLVSFRLAAYFIVALLALSAYFSLKSNKTTRTLYQCQISVTVLSPLDFRLDKTINNLQFDARADSLLKTQPPQAQCQALLGRHYRVSLNVKKEQLTKLLKAMQLRLELTMLSHSSLFGIRSIPQWKLLP